MPPVAPQRSLADPTEEPASHGGQRRGEADVNALARDLSNALSSVAKTTAPSQLFELNLASQSAGPSISTFPACQASCAAAAIAWRAGSAGLVAGCGVFGASCYKDAHQDWGE